MQTAGISDPSNIISTAPGSLAGILPFATKRHANSIELFTQDLFTAYDPWWTLYDDSAGAMTCGSVPCNVIYANAIANAAAGLPAATALVQGQAAMQGKVLQQ